MLLSTPPKGIVSKVHVVRNNVSTLRSYALQKNGDLYRPWGVGIAGIHNEVARDEAISPLLKKG